MSNPGVKIGILDIIKYVGIRSRPLQEGEAVFKAGHVILCGLAGEGSHNITSLCLQTSALTNKPHTISISWNENVDNWKCACSCKAGASGFCKHIVATLIHINRLDKLEVVSCTDVEQKWGKEKKNITEYYKAKPFKDFCHPVSKKQKETFETTTELDRRNFELLCTVLIKNNRFLGVSDSALTRFITRSADSSLGLKPNLAIQKNRLKTAVETLLTHVEKSQFLSSLKTDLCPASYNLIQCCQQILKDLGNCNVLEVAVDIQQGSSRWGEERQLRITGSTCYAIYTFSKENEWENKSKKFFFPKKFTSKYTEHGKRYEKEALEVFQRENKENHIEVVTPGLIICKCYPWLRFSADGIIFKNDAPSILLEIKCPFIGKDYPITQILETCEYIYDSEEGIQFKKKHTYYGQIQLGMALLNIKEAKMILYSSFEKKYVEIRVLFDEEFARDLLTVITQKYFTKMLHHFCLNKM